MDEDIEDIDEFVAPPQQALVAPPLPAPAPLVPQLQQQIPETYAEWDEEEGEGMEFERQQQAPVAPSTPAPMPQIQQQIPQTYAGWEEDEFGDEMDELSARERQQQIPATTPPPPPATTPSPKEEIGQTYIDYGRGGIWEWNG